MKEAVIAIVATEARADKTLDRIPEAARILREDLYRRIQLISKLVNPKGLLTDELTTVMSPLTYESEGLCEGVAAFLEGGEHPSSLFHEFSSPADLATMLRRPRRWMAEATATAPAI